jgi:hypothetical protein
MFAVTSNDIANLNDKDLRELVAKLCEAECHRLNLFSASVIRGGHQDAKDGGIDVRVSSTQEFIENEYLPRSHIGFQVKKPNMARSNILKEMKPKALRPAILELAHLEGAYILVSSGSDLTDSALKNRREAMREALTGLDTAYQLHTDFFDRTRLASWAQKHPGVALWVLEKVGPCKVGNLMPLGVIIKKGLKPNICWIKKAKLSLKEGTAPRHIPFLKG